jgi:3-methyladenine DNA glycosylase AlkD
MHVYLKSVKKAFIQHADAEKAKGAKAYMRNQFEFYGIQTPVRRMITKEIFASGLPSFQDIPAIMKDAWQQPEREYQYFAIELLGKMKKEWKPDLIPVLEEMITEKSWWDSVDHIATWILGPFFQKFPELIKKMTKKWNQSDNLWLQRSSIMFQKAYREKTDTGLLSEYINHCKGSGEFFIQKAIGWSLREYAKTDPKWVRSFVQKNQLPALSKREALKNIE